MFLLWVRKEWTKIYTKERMWIEANGCKLILEISLQRNVTCNMLMHMPFVIRYTVYGIITIMIIWNWEHFKVVYKQVILTLLAKNCFWVQSLRVYSLKSSFSFQFWAQKCTSILIAKCVKFWKIMLNFQNFERINFWKIYYSDFITKTVPELVLNVFEVKLLYNTFGNKAPIQRNVEASNLLSNLFKFKVKSGIFKQTSFGTNNKFYIDFSHNLSKQCWCKVF